MNPVFKLVCRVIVLNCSLLVFEISEAPAIWPDSLIVSFCGIPVLLERSVLLCELSSPRDMRKVWPQVFLLSAARGILGEQHMEERQFQSMPG